MTPKAGLYVRVSDPEQVEGYSIDAQLLAGRERAVLEGWELQEYVEPGRSAKTDDRPVYQAWLADLEAGHLDIAMVHKLDRMSRSVLDILTAFKSFERWDVQFVSLSEAFDFTTPIGKVVLTILAAFAEWYLANLAQETRKGMRQKVLAGGTPWLAPLGYTNKQDNGRAYVESCPTMGPLITRGFQALADGQTLRQWTATAYQDGYRTRTGRKIYKSTWGRIFRDRYYLGYTYWRADDIEVEGEHPPLTDPDTFDRVQAMLDQRRPDNKGVTWKHPYLLRGLLWSMDGECKMWGETQGRKGIAYYRTAVKVGGQVIYIPCVVLDGQVPALLRQIRAKQGLTLPKDQQHLTLALKVAPDVCAVYTQLSSFEDRQALLHLVFKRIAVCGERLDRAGSMLKESFEWIHVNLAPLAGLDNPIIHVLNGLLGNGNPVPTEAL